MTRRSRSRSATSRIPEWLDVEQLIREIALATVEGDWALRIVARPRRTLLAQATVPPLGWTCPSARSRPTRGTVPRPISARRKASRGSSRGKDVGRQLQLRAARGRRARRHAGRGAARDARGPGRSGRRPSCIGPTSGTKRRSRRRRASSARRRAVRAHPGRLRQPVREPARPRAPSAAGTSRRIARRRTVRGRRARASSSRAATEKSPLATYPAQRASSPPVESRCCSSTSRSTSWSTERACDDDPPLDGPDQPRRQPLARGSRRARAADPGRPAARPVVVLVRLVPRRRRPARAGSTLPAAVPRRSRQRRRLPVGTGYGAARSVVVGAPPPGRHGSKRAS